MAGSPPCTCSPARGSSTSKATLLLTLLGLEPSTMVFWMSTLIGMLTGAAEGGFCMRMRTYLQIQAIVIAAKTAGLVKIATVA